MNIYFDTMVNVKNIVLGIGIVVVYALVLWQGIEAFYPSPQYDQYCTSLNYPVSFPYKEGYQADCTVSKELADEQNQCYSEQGNPIPEYDSNGCVIGVKECDFCNKNFNDAQLAHSKRVFYISVVIAIFTIIIGFSILSIEPVGSALIGSSIWALFYGSVVNWRNFSSIWRFLVLFIALALLIYFAIRFNKRKKSI
jgi:hypothetical protein